MLDAGGDCEVVRAREKTNVVVHFSDLQCGVIDFLSRSAPLASCCTVRHSILTSRGRIREVFRVVLFEQRCDEALEEC